MLTQRCEMKRLTLFEVRRLNLLSTEDVGIVDDLTLEANRSATETHLLKQREVVSQH